MYKYDMYDKDGNVIGQEVRFTKRPEENEDSEKKKFNWKPLAIVGGIAAAVGAGIFRYSKYRSNSDSEPVAALPGDDETVELDVVDADTTTE